MRVKGNIVDIHNRIIYYGAITIDNGVIKKIEQLEGKSDQYILPGFIDAHVHIESSMLIPSEFARMAVVHGTVASVSDPHEIANVLGVVGVHYMIENGKQVPFKFNFGAPSCVPATSFETAGAVIDVTDIEALLDLPDIKYLAEMMNYPGVLFKDEMVMAKIASAKRVGKPIDGHAPGLQGQDAINYIQAGISTDHECFTYEEALGKLQNGMKVIIREGSAAKNFEALIDLLPQYPQMMMFCSDDKHPDDLIEGHINQLVARALKKGYDLFDVLQVACLNPIAHYQLDVGQLRVEDSADFIVVSDLEKFEPIATYIDGNLVAKEGQTLIEKVEATVLNNFNIAPKSPEDFRLSAKSSQVNTIRAIDGELITESFTGTIKIENDNAVSNIEQDILKMVVVNRYQDAPPAIAFIQGFNLKKGAIASCVGHDSHNIIAVGVDDQSICQVVNEIIQYKGGIAACSEKAIKVLPLPIAGIMTNEDGYKVAKQYSEVDVFVKTEMGSTLNAPFMTLSFMALLVIPQLKLSDQGLFDGKQFQFVDLFV